MKIIKTIATARRFENGLIKIELDEEYGRANEVYSVKANETTYPIIYLERSDYEPYPCYNYPNPDQEKWIGVAGKYEMRQDYINKPIAALEGKTILFFDFHTFLDSSCTVCAFLFVNYNTLI